jgi:DNA mismatch repair protein MutS2
MGQKSAILLFHGKRVSAGFDQLEPVGAASAPVATTSKVSFQPKAVGPTRLEESFVLKQQDSSTTLDLHGYTVEEATEALEEFLSQAMLSGLPTIRIMHGIGSGRLRSFIQSYLKRHRDIASVRYADTREGGIGVTVAELR